MTVKTRHSFTNERFFTREDFLLRCKNLDPNMVVKYSKIVNDIAEDFYNKNRQVLFRNGYEVDDMVNSINLLVMYFHELYSPNSNDKYFDKAWQRIEHKNGSSHQISNEDWEKMVRSDMINFIKSQLVTLKKRLYLRNENISVGKASRRYFAPTLNSVQAPAEEIARNPVEFGYSEISLNKYEALEPNKQKSIMSVTVFDSLQPEEYGDIMYASNSYDNPVDRIIESEQEVVFSQKADMFKSMNSKKRRKFLEDFIKQNQHDPSMRSEVQTVMEALSSRRF
jgi:hypothetical protein